MAVETKEFGSCIVKREEKVATLLFNRPEKMNAFGPELFESMQEAFKDIAGDENVRAVIITGAGDHFSAGGDVEQDINPLRSKSVQGIKDYFDPLGDAYNFLYRMEKPTIAAINGFALGAGMELTLMCDFRIMADNAQLGEFFVKMGLIPEAGMCILPKLVGPGMAKMICYTGKLINAEEALRIRLVEEVVPKDELIPAAEKLARKLARGPASIKIMKRAINEFGDLPLEMTLNQSIAYQFQATRTKDHEEAVTAFLEKRKPNFTGN